MPRPRKFRQVCHFPNVLEFKPVGLDESKSEIIMTIDEYETIRLIDKEGFSQEQCGEQMKIARTTVQMIYTSARKKMADAIVDGCSLRIEGGDYHLCSGNDAFCEKGACYKRKYNEQYAKMKGEQVMRIAVTYENGQIFQHFGHTEQFKVYDVEDGKVVASEVVGTEGSGHGALAGILNALNVDVLICGGIGQGARVALNSVNIQICPGTNGNCDELVQAYISGNLVFDPNTECHHHDHEHTCDHTHSFGKCGL